jgi:hypothetical protein
MRRQQKLFETTSTKIEKAPQKNGGRPQQKDADLKQKWKTTTKKEIEDDLKENQYGIGRRRGAVNVVFI